MIASWIAAAAIMLVAGLAGRMVTRIGGAERWTGLEPAAGFAVIVVTGSLLAKVDPDRSVLLLGLVALALVSLAILRPVTREDLPSVPVGLAVALGAVFVLMCVPFIAAGEWGVPGTPTGGGFLAEELPSAPGEAGWVLLKWFIPGGILGVSVSTGLLIACGLTLAWTGWTAADRLAGWKRPLAAVLIATPYLVVSAYSAGFFRLMAAALFLLGFLVAIDQALRSARSRPDPTGSGREVAALLVPAVLTAGTLCAFLFVGDSFGVIAGRMTGPVSPVEALGVWLNPDYRHDGDTATPLPGLLGAIGVLALLVSLGWWTREPRSPWPFAVLAGGAVYLIALLFAGEDVRGHVLTVISPVVTAVILVAMLAGPRKGWKPQQGMEFGGWVSLATLFVIGSLVSGFIVLRDATVTTSGRPAGVTRSDVTGTGAVTERSGAGPGGSALPEGATGSGPEAAPLSPPPAPPR